MSGVERVRGNRAHQDGVAIRFGAGDTVGADVATGTLDILDDDLLAEIIGHLLLDDAGDDIGRAAGGHHQGHRPVREFLGYGLRRQGQQRSSRKPEGQCHAAGEFRHRYAPPFWRWHLVADCVERRAYELCLRCQCDVGRSAEERGLPGAASADNTG